MTTADDPPLEHDDDDFTLHPPSDTLRISSIITIPTHPVYPSTYPSLSILHRRTSSSSSLLHTRRRVYWSVLWRNVSLFNPSYFMQHYTYHHSHRVDQLPKSAIIFLTPPTAKAYHYSMYIGKKNKQNLGYGVTSFVIGSLSSWYLYILVRISTTFCPFTYYATKLPYTGLFIAHKY